MLETNKPYCHSILVENMPLIINFPYSVHVAVEEKISVTAGRDGGLQSLELHGMVKLSINDAKMGRVVLAVANNDKKGAQLQVGHQIDFTILFF